MGHKKYSNIQPKELAKLKKTAYKKIRKIMTSDDYKKATMKD